MYVSRSQLEAYISRCQYQAYIHYAYEVEEQKIGLSPSFFSIDLACGTAIHAGMSILLAELRANPKKDFKTQDFDNALFIALGYLDDSNIRDRKLPAENELLQEFSKKEHRWLIEALLWSWFRVELPKIQASKKVILVEKEIEVELTRIKDKNRPKARVLRSMDEAVSGKFPVEYEDEIVTLASRCDALLLDLETETLEAQSFKSTKQMGIFTDQMVNRDLQTALEIFALEHWLEIQDAQQKVIANNIAELHSFEDAGKIARYLQNLVPTKTRKVEACKYTFLVKGNRNDKDSFSLLGEDYKLYPLRDSKLLYGWRKLLEKTTQDDAARSWEYAHSFNFFKPENASGEGRLGKGWKKFIVEEEYPGGIRKWIDDIIHGQIQPDAKNPIQSYIVTETDSRIDSQIRAQVYTAKRAAEEFFQRSRSEVPQMEFLANTQSCTWPTLCDFAMICNYAGISLFNPEIASDPIASGLYQIRVPHHEPERKFFENASSKNKQS